MPYTTMPFCAEDQFNKLIERLDSQTKALDKLYEAVASKDTDRVIKAMYDVVEHYKNHTFVALYQGEDKPWFMYHI